MVEKESSVKGLGPGFWPFTGLLTLLAIANMYFWAVTPLSRWMPTAVTVATQIDELFRVFLAVGIALFIYILGYAIFFSIVFRARKDDPPDALGVQIHDNHKLELWWTVLPTIAVILISWVSVRVWFPIQIASASTPAGLVVESIGHQWFYTFRYPGINGEVTGNMHLPVGEPVTLNVSSEDVIHSFWVPAMRLKQDMVPGLINVMRFTTDRVGRYRIICTEFCGVEHGVMNKQYLVIEPKAQFDAWYHGWQVKNATASNALPQISSAPIDLSDGSAAAGQVLFSQKCSACHAIAPFSKRIVGPGLKGVLHDPAHPNLLSGKPATPANVAEILQHGLQGSYGQMPTQVQNALTDKDIANLVAYLNSLK